MRMKAFVGAVNRNGIKCVEITDIKSEHHAYSKLFRVWHADCDEEYLVQGCDFYQRRCPFCQGGQPANEGIKE